MAQKTRFRTGENTRRFRRLPSAHSTHPASSGSCGRLFTENLNGLSLSRRDEPSRYRQTTFWLSFPRVCPEPVLANDRFALEKHRIRLFARTPVRRAARRCAKEVI